MKNTTIRAAYIILSALLLAACTSSSVQKQPPTNFNTADILPDEHMPDGIYHSMQPGETLWQISRKYGVQLSDILRYNEGLDTRDITVGTRIFIPQPHYGVSDIQDPLPLADAGYPWPVNGRITREHSSAKPGLSITVAAGQNVKAIRSGKVILSTAHFPGRWIIIDHGNFWGIYGNLGSRAVAKSTFVEQGQVIGTTGNRPLHIEFRRNGNPFDPRELLGK